ncbi:MAG: hypothetical protein LUQ32_00060 [Methanomicrobiales archaeon]|nr:hypothetical protein [Methanomicrobiales archaeon]
MQSSHSRYRPRTGWVVALLLLGVFLLPQGSPAHPPSDLQLAFDEGARVLSVTITHPVADPATHYVKRVLVTAGGSTLSEHAYTSQPASPFTYSYPLPPSAAGEIQVVAECSIQGSATRSLQVPEGPPAGSPAPGTTVPGRATLTVTPPSPPGAPPGTRATLPPAPATTEAAPGVFPFAAALALAAWRFRR